MRQPFDAYSLARRENVGPAAAVYCLGTFKISLRGEPPAVWRLGRERILFEYLVSHHNRVIPRDVLIEALWPDPEVSAAARVSLKVAVHALRRELVQVGADRVGLRVVSTKSGYELSAPHLWVDAEQFERSVENARALCARGADPEGITAYRHAVRLYQGDFLPDSDADWAVFRREALKDHALHALARLADAAFAALDYEACQGLCQQILAHDKCREDTYRLLILCHIQLGQPARARRWFELCASVLRSELDVEPQPETVALLRDAYGEKKPRTAHA